MDDLITYMDYLWLQVEDDIITLGLNDEGLEGFDHVTNLDLPHENSEVYTDEICGELETDQGPLNIYSPVDGRIVEINEAAIQNPDLIRDDSYGDGWLIRIETADLERIDNIASHPLPTHSGMEDDN